MILRLKFFQSSSGGHVTVTSTSSKILHSLSGLSHPIPRLILSAVKGHLEGYSDGGLRTAILLLRCLISYMYFIYQHIQHIATATQFYFSNISIARTMTGTKEF